MRATGTLISVLLHFDAGHFDAGHRMDLVPPRVIFSVTNVPGDTVDTGNAGR
jgi:hypothetical protein